MYTAFRSGEWKDLGDLEEAEGKKQKAESKKQKAKSEKQKAESIARRSQGGMRGEAQLGRKFVPILSGAGLRAGGEGSPQRKSRYYFEAQSWRRVE